MGDYPIWLPCADAPEVLPVIPKLYVGGHSIAAGSAPLPNSANRITMKLARSLGATETNVALASAGMLAANHTCLPPSKLSQGGNWPTVMQNYDPARTAAPYLPSIVIADLMYGINDIAQYGPVNATFLVNWESVLFALVCYLRSGAIKTYQDASIAYSSLWTAYASTDQCAGGGAYYTPTNGQTVTITVPADYDGQAINLFLLTGAGANPAASATHTVTVNGRPIGQWSTTGINRATNGGAHQTQPYCVRLPNGLTGLVPGSGNAATIVVTVSSILGDAIFNCWAIESVQAPLVVLADTLRTPRGYGAYTSLGWPYTPTDADVLAINAANASVAEMFSDGMVICDGADAIVGKGGFAADWSNVHPMERVAAQIARIQRNAIAMAFQPELATVSELGSA